LPQGKSDGVLFDGSKGVAGSAFADSNALPAIDSISRSSAHILDDDMLSRFGSKSAVIS
jgi:hypothetical protein